MFLSVIKLSSSFSLALCCFPYNKGRIHTTVQSKEGHAIKLSVRKNNSFSMPRPAKVSIAGILLNEPICFIRGLINTTEARTSASPCRPSASETIYRECLVWPKCLLYSFSSCFEQKNRSHKRMCGERATVKVKGAQAISAAKTSNTRGQQCAKRNLYENWWKHFHAFVKQSSWVIS